MDDEDDDLDPVDVTGNGVPANANAGALLDAATAASCRTCSSTRRCRPASAAGSPTCARRCSPATRELRIHAAPQDGARVQARGPAGRRCCSGSWPKESNGKACMPVARRRGGPMQFMFVPAAAWLGNDGSGFRHPLRPAFGRQAPAVPEAAHALNNKASNRRWPLQRRRGPRAARVPVQRRAQLLGFDVYKPVPVRNPRLRADGDRRGMAVPASARIWLALAARFVEPSSMRLQRPTSLNSRHLPRQRALQLRLPARAA